MALSREDEARYPKAASRIKAYAEKRAVEDAKTASTDALEAQIDESNRRAVRLNQQLLNEATLRARAERNSKIMSEELEEFRTKLAAAEEKLNAKSRSRTRAKQGGERPRPGGEVPDGIQRVDGSPAPERTGNPESADSSSDASPDGPDPGRRSARVRGTAK